MPQYSAIEKFNFQQKDKRITFLSIFSSLTVNQTSGYDQAYEKAVELTDKIYEKYPDKVEGDDNMEVIAM